MTTIEFKLENQEYIQLNQLLKYLQLVATGGEALVRIDNGEVKVNGEVELRRRNKLYKGFVVEFKDHAIKIV